MEILQGYQIVRADESHIPDIALNNRNSIFEQNGYELPPAQALHAASVAIHFPNSHFYVLVDQENRVLAQYKQVFAWNDLIDRPLVWIERLYVRPEYRRHGLAKVMIDHCLELLTTRTDEAPLPLIFAMVGTANMKSLGLGKSNGFEELEYKVLSHITALTEVRNMRNSD